MTPGAYTYAYDPIGNRTEISLGGASRFYSTDEVNRYWAVGDGEEETDWYNHDDDGNMIGSEVDYQGVLHVWDAENRLIQLRSDAGEGAKKVVLDYDYMSRRVRKRVFDWDVVTEDWEEDATQDQRFVYDQWNVVEVLSGTSNTIQQKYTWGLDLSGQAGSGVAPVSNRWNGVLGLHGAGGIGGLLAAVETGGDHAGSYWFLYDANGNVGQVIKASDQTLAAHYEYDPYGNLLNTPTGYAATNPFRFSTKWFDDETGLGYWGYRYYSPKLGSSSQTALWNCILM